MDIDSNQVKTIGEVPQVKTLRDKCALSLDEVKINCDSISIRAFVTYLVKRHDGSVRRVFW